MPPSLERAAVAAPRATDRADRQSESGQLENLNEGQLRALLDEAVNYKRPKDREGKSNLFKNLLQEAEQDDFLHGRTSICSSSGSGSGGGKRGRVKRSLATFPHSGSLQDLAGAGAGPDVRAPRPQTRHRRTVPVSQRSYHGGSLPANVDQQNFGVNENRHSFLEDVRYKGVGTRVTGGDYIATVRCVNPPPLGSDTSSEYMVSHESERVSSPPANSPQSSSYSAGFFDDDGTEMELISAQNIPHIPNYKTRATLEIGSSSMTGESTVDRGIAFSLIDTNHGCISSPMISQSQAASVLETKPLQLASSYNAVRSITDGGGHTNNVTTAFPVNSQLNVISQLNLLQPHHPLDSDKKFDENYNSVQTVNSITGQHPKKTKRKKFHRNETETLAQDIDGYRGNANIEDLMKFIESDADNIKQSGKYQSKSNSDVGINGKVSNRDKAKDDNDNDKNGKKRSSERKAKDGKLDSKMKRANSMEELSRRKLDDLTSKDTFTLRKVKKSSGGDADSKSNDRRSWCNEDEDVADQFYKRESEDLEDLSNLNSKNKKLKPAEVVDLSLYNCDTFYNFETADFQTVTKKKKLRKRHSPSDENRHRANNIYNNNAPVGKTNSSGRTGDRDAIFKRNGNRPSASSPPSDKSNDSNDDLDSVHSLPADASGERLQASYADMARAAPSTSPPPPPMPIARQRNFPDLIESCNYYSNDILIQDKNVVDVTVENTKNLILKNKEADQKTTQLREQYPALKSESKHVNNKPSKAAVKNADEKIVEKRNQKTEESFTENCPTQNENVNEGYVDFSKVNSAVNSSTPLMKVGSKSSKPPDVVLPIAEMSQPIDHRPAVIIMNEEVSRSSDVVYNNVDGITFGFDINEQLISGSGDKSSSFENSNGVSSDSSSNIFANSMIDFPAINEKPCNEKTKSHHDDYKHSKIKNNRVLSKEFAKCNIRNNNNNAMVPYKAGASAEFNDDNKDGEMLAGSVVETRIGRDKSLRYLTPTTTSKDNYNLDRIVHYVGMAWEDIIKSSGDKIRYFNEKQ